MTADILMYHSISPLPGATSIPVPVFQAQMQAIAAAGASVISLDDLHAAWRGDQPLPAKSVVLTFDDGYLDFAEQAWPVIRDHGWPVTVFLPTKFVGDRERWQGHATPPRPLMSWQQIASLAEQGVTFGGHTHSHPDLSALAPDDVAMELTNCRDEIARHTGSAPEHFAPPYGRGTPDVQKAIKAIFQTSCGTRLARAQCGEDLFDLPRIEMFYYRDIGRWRQHLAGRGGPYLALRKALRAVRAGVAAHRIPA